jgi:hypothetical protein
MKRGTKKMKRINKLARKKKKKNMNLLKKSIIKSENLNYKIMMINMDLQSFSIFGREKMFYIN